MFRRTSSRGGRGRRAAADFVVCFGCGGFLLFFSSFFSFERTPPAAQVCGRPASFTSLLVPGCVQGCNISSVCLSVSVCVTFVVTDCESCMRPIFDKPGIYGSGRVYGLTRGTCLV